MVRTQGRHRQTSVHRRDGHCICPRLQVVPGAIDGGDSEHGVPHVVTEKTCMGNIPLDGCASLHEAYACLQRVPRSATGEDASMLGQTNRHHRGVDATVRHDRRKVTANAARLFCMPGPLRAMIERGEWDEIVANMIEFGYILSVQIAVCQAVCELLSETDATQARGIVRLLHTSGFLVQVVSVMEQCTRLCTLEVLNMGMGVVTAADGGDGVGDVDGDGDGNGNGNGDGDGDGDGDVAYMQKPAYVNAEYHAQILDLHCVSCQMLSRMYNVGTLDNIPESPAFDGRVHEAMCAVIFTHATSTYTGDDTAAARRQEAVNQQTLLLYSYILDNIQNLGEESVEMRRIDATAGMYALYMFPVKTPQDCVYAERQKEIFKFVDTMLHRELPRNRGIIRDYMYLREAIQPYPGVLDVFLQYMSFMSANEGGYKCTSFSGVMQFSVLNVFVARLRITSIEGLYNPAVIRKLVACVRVVEPVILKVRVTALPVHFGACRDVLQILCALLRGRPGCIDEVVAAGAIDTALALVARIVSVDRQATTPEIECMAVCCQILCTIASAGRDYAERVYRHRGIQFSGPHASSSPILVPVRVIDKLRIPDHAYAPSGHLRTTQIATVVACMDLLERFAGSSDERAVQVYNSHGFEAVDIVMRKISIESAKIQTSGCSILGMVSAAMHGQPVAVFLDAVSTVVDAMHMLHENVSLRARAVDALAGIYFSRETARIPHPAFSHVVPLLVAAVCDRQLTEECADKAQQLLRTLIHEDGRDADGNPRANRAVRVRTSRVCGAIDSLLSVFKRRCDPGYRRSQRVVEIEVSADHPFDHSPEGIDAVVYVMCALLQFMWECHFFRFNNRNKRSHAAIFTYCVKSLVAYAEANPVWRRGLRDHRVLGAILRSTVAGDGDDGGDSVFHDIHSVVHHVDSFFAGADMHELVQWCEVFAQRTLLANCL